MNKPKILVGVVVYNEEDKIKKVLEKLDIVATHSDYFILFIDDHSTDNSIHYLKNFVQNNKNSALLYNKKNSGVGKSIKKIIDYGLNNNYDICVIMAGNGKDNPFEIKNILKPILENQHDYVQGSRFLKGGSFNNLPLIRKFMIKGFTFLFFLFTSYRGTDASNGFRAYKLNIFKNVHIKKDQLWLDRYEFETYLHYKVITLGYSVCEVGVSKNYLHGIKNYSKIRPFIDWWRMSRPLFYLKFGIKK